MARARKAILHIGTEKTGTSTLQIFLQRNRQRLNANGFHYPAFGGNTNQTRLAAYAQNDEARDDLRIDLGIDGPEDLAEFRARMREAAAAEVAEHADKVFVMSNEHCSSRLNGPRSVGRLRDFLAPLFDEIWIAVYLRRQDLVAVSLYSTLLKFGGDRENVLPDPGIEPGRWNHGHLLGLWAEAFGRDRVVPRIFDRGELRGGSIVTDFVEQWGLGSGYEPVANANESLEPRAAEVLRRLNTHFPGYIGLELNPMRGELGERIAQLFPGRGIRPSRAEAEAFYANFTALNEACRAEWFPERKTLFPEDFSGYPEVADGREFTFEDAIAVMVGLWDKTQSNEIRLRHELALRDGELAELRGDPGAAREAYARAIRIDPNRPLARRRLASLEAALAAAERSAEKADAAAAEQAGAPAGGGTPAEPAPAAVASEAQLAPVDAAPARPAEPAPAETPAPACESVAEVAPPAAGAPAPAMALAADGDRAATLARWARDERRLARMAKLRKRLSLNGIRRLLGVPPR